MKNLYTNTEIDRIAKHSIEEIECSEIWESYLRWKAEGNEDKCYIDYFEHMINEFFEFLENFNLNEFIELESKVSLNKRRN